MDHFQQIYRRSPAAYHRLIAHEDAAGALMPRLERLVPLHRRSVLDLGSGTGRFPLLLQTYDARVVALDLYAAMLHEQVRQRDQHGGRWPLVQADMRALPLAPAQFDLCLAGWSLGHFCGWYGPDWRRQMTPVLRGMLRAARSKGHLVIIETLSTGSPIPRPPTVALGEYYHWLEAEWGFAREVVATDYRFPSVTAAEAHLRFFFGPALADKAAAEAWRTVPEWTGIWHRPVSR